MCHGYYIICKLTLFVEVFILHFLFRSNTCTGLTKVNTPKILPINSESNPTLNLMPLLRKNHYQSFRDTFTETSHEIIQHIYLHQYAGVGLSAQNDICKRCCISLFPWNQLNLSF